MAELSAPFVSVSIYWSNAELVEMLQQNRRDPGRHDKHPRARVHLVHSHRTKLPPPVLWLFGLQANPKRCRRRQSTRRCRRLIFLPRQEIDRDRAALPVRQGMALNRCPWVLVSRRTLT